MRLCPFNGCDVKVKEVIFACPRHWHSLSKANQKEIYAAHNDYLTCKIDLPELRERQQAVLDDAQGKGKEHGKG